MGLHTDCLLWWVSSKLIFPIIFVIPDKQRIPSISTMVFNNNMFLTQLNLAGW